MAEIYENDPSIEEHAEEPEEQPEGQPAAPEEPPAVPAQQSPAPAPDYGEKLNALEEKLEKVYQTVQLFVGCGADVTDDPPAPKQQASELTMDDFIDEPGHDELDELDLRL